MSAGRKGLANIVDDLLASLLAGKIPVRDVREGPFRTVVWTESGAGLVTMANENGQNTEDER